MLSYNRLQPRLISIAIWHSEMTEVFQDRLREIQKRGETEPASALEELTTIVNEGIESASVWMLKATYHFRLGENANAVEAFSKVVLRKPRDENASLGLFQSLWGAGERDKAFEEMKRYFQEVGIDSQSQTAMDYHSIIDEINEFDV